MTSGCYGDHGGWTPEIIDQLCRLWDGGMPTAEIGRRIGFSKNAVVGKVHRLELAARRSPIRGGNRRQKPLAANADPMPLGAGVRAEAVRPVIAAPVRPAVAAGGALRLDLPARPSPIAPGAHNRLGPHMVEAEPWPPLLAAGVGAEAPRPVIAAPVRPVVFAVTRRGRIEPCCWIIGERGPGRTWLHCDSDSMPGRPYCLAHENEVSPKIKPANDQLARGASAGEEG
jgi:GcrA cell cycle regulator